MNSSRIRENPCNPWTKKGNEAMKTKTAFLALAALAASAMMPAALDAETGGHGEDSSSPCLRSSVPSALGAAGPSPIVAETLLADGTTNTWTQADLVAALGLLNRRYRRDIQTDAGRRAWHGAETRQTLLTNDAGRIFMRRTYADGFTFDDEGGRMTVQQIASNAALRVRLSLPTNGVSPRVASIRARSAAASLAGETNVTVIVTAGGSTVRRAPRYERAFDDYGNETNKALVGWADGALTVRTLDLDGRVLSEQKLRKPAAARQPAALNAEEAEAGRRGEASGSATPNDPSPSLRASASSESNAAKDASVHTNGVGGAFDEHGVWTNTVFTGSGWYTAAAEGEGGQ